MTSPELSVELFGGPKVTAASGPLDLTAHQQALLTAVYGHGPGGISRPQLGWLLWEEDDSPSLRRRIRQLLYRTNSRLGLALLTADHDTLRPTDAGASDDLSDFRERLRRGPMADAAGLLSRGFADRLTSMPTEAFEDWLSAKRISLLEDLRDAASRRWDETSGAGLWGEARDAAEALHMLSPQDISVAMRVIEARARTGSIASAEAVHAALEEESITPDERKSLAELMQRVQRLQASPTSKRHSKELTPEAPLVGRRREIDDATSVFADVHSGHFRVVLIIGEGGIGKTRVLEEVRKEGVLAGFRCLLARPSEPERHIPLNPLADAFSDIDLAGHLRALGKPWRSVIASLLPIEDTEPVEETPPIQEDHLSRRLMDALYFLWERIADEEPTLLFIDDLQWADATTVTALQFIQRRWSGGPLGVIAAVRPNRIEPYDPVSRYLLQDEHVPIKRIDLHGLTQPEGRQLVELLMGEEVEEQVSDRLCELGALHPLYLTEVTKEYRAGRLRLPELPVDEVAIPVSLQEIFRRRVSLISATSTKVGGILAVRAKPMRLTDVAELTGLPLSHCADCAEELQQMGLVVLSGDELGITHELFRTALYQQLSDARRAVLHRSLAEHLSAKAPGQVPEGELAMHFARAGERASAVRHGWAAASSAIESGAVAEAAYFFELVVKNEDDEVRQALATGELARALHLGRSIERANPVLELASVRLRQTGDPNRALRMDIRRVEGLAESDAAPAADLIRKLQAIKGEAEELGDWEALALALDVELRFAHHHGDIRRGHELLTSIQQLQQQHGGRARVVANCALSIGILFGWTDVARSAAADVVELTRGQQHPYRLRALNRAIIVRYHQGLMRSVSSQELLREARLVAKSHGDLVERFSLEGNIAAELMDAGYLDESETVHAEAAKILGRGDMAFSRVNIAFNRGELALARGDYERARTYFLSAAGHLSGSVPSYTSDFVNAGVGLASLELGDIAEARARYVDLHDPPSVFHYDPTTIIQFRARFLERTGKATAARSVLDETADAVEDRLVLAWLKIRLLQVRLLIKLGDETAITYAEQGLRLAESLDIAPRVWEFQRLLARARRAAPSGRS